MKSSLVALLMSLSACCMNPKEISLDARWRPLEKLQRSDEPSGAGAYWTVVPVVYTKDLCDFLRMSSVDQAGLLVHERLHAVRQLATYRGPQQYLFQYATDAAFRADEEKLCWEAEITYVVQHGSSVDADYVATFMSTNYHDNEGRPLWNYDTARKWVEDAIARARQ